MKLWVLRRIHTKYTPVWDCSNAFVIRAKTETDARIAASKLAGDEGADTWLFSAHSSCDILEKTGKAGIILRSFRAG